MDIKETKTNTKDPKKVIEDIINVTKLGTKREISEIFWHAVGLLFFLGLGAFAFTFCVIFVRGALGEADSTFEQFLSGIFAIPCFLAGIVCMYPVYLSIKFTIRYLIGTSKTVANSVTVVELEDGSLIRADGLTDKDVMVSIGKYIRVEYITRVEKFQLSKFTSDEPEQAENHQ